MSEQTSGDGFLIQGRWQSHVLVRYDLECTFLVSRIRLMHSAGVYHMFTCFHSELHLFLCLNSWEDQRTTQRYGTILRTNLLTVAAASWLAQLAQIMVYFKIVYHVFLHTGPLWRPFNQVLSTTGTWFWDDRVQQGWNRWRSTRNNNTGNTLDAATCLRKTGNPDNLKTFPGGFSCLDLIKRDGSADGKTQQWLKLRWV